MRSIDLILVFVSIVLGDTQIIPHNIPLIHSNNLRILVIEFCHCIIAYARVSEIEDARSTNLGM